MAQDPALGWSYDEHPFDGWDVRAVIRTLKIRIGPIDDE